MSHKYEHLANSADSNRGRGRPRGSPNWVTREMRDFAISLLTDPAYRASARRRLIAGEAPALEAKLWDRLLPAQLVMLVGNPESDLSSLTTAELLERAELLTELLRVKAEEEGERAQPVMRLLPPAPEASPHEDIETAVIERDETRSE